MKRAKDKSTHLKEAILIATRTILLKDGYGNLSMRRIASVVGYSPTTLYNYFKNKDDIIFNLCNGYFVKLADVLFNSVCESDPIDVKICKCLTAYVKFGLEDPDSYHIAFMMNLSDENGYSFVEQGSNGMKAYDFIRSLIAEEFEEPDIAAQTCWNMAHGIVSNLIMNRHFSWAEPEKLIDTAAHTLLRGLRRQTK